MINPITIITIIPQVLSILQQLTSLMQTPAFLNGETEIIAQIKLLETGIKDLIAKI